MADVSDDSTTVECGVVCSIQVSIIRFGYAVKCIVVPLLKPLYYYTNSKASYL